jgi:endonuclease/exonuclease/phosphatase family metal-dependent hydrolase
MKLSRKSVSIVVVTMLTQTVGCMANTFTTAAFNVDGIPPDIKKTTVDGIFKFLLTPITGTPNDARQQAHRTMSSYINQFDIVNVQEDFNYHAALYDSGNNHPYRTATTGGVGFGSGLNTLSRFQYWDYQRVQWNQCSGAEECAGKKGFTFMRVNVMGKEVDMYNVHMGAKVDADALAKRRNQNQQLLDFVQSKSKGRTIIIFGDFNSRWTRAEDNLEIFRNVGFKDAWAEVLRGGDYPGKGGVISCAFPQFTGPDCEVVDKALYLDGANLGLRPLSYELKQDVLSDHLPMVVKWSFGSSWSCNSGNNNANKVGEVTINWGHNEGDAAWACNAWNNNCQGKCAAKPAKSSWGCYRNGNKVGDVTIDWGHEEGDAAYACNAWNNAACQGQCTAGTSWKCKLSNGYLMSTVSIGWGNKEGDATWACNSWTPKCNNSCKAEKIIV